MASTSMPHVLVLPHWVHLYQLQVYLDQDLECPHFHQKTKAAECLLIRNPSDLFAVLVILLSNTSGDGERRVKNDKYQSTALHTTNTKVGEHRRYCLHAAVYHTDNGTVECHLTAVVQLEN